MTAYIAICDNNIADRKQLERLLEREKDARLHNNHDVLYIDSFGSEEALMATPIRYDLFIIDMTEGGASGMEIAEKLRQRGIAAPIVLCGSTVSYSSYVNSPEDIIFIEKPLGQGQVSNLTDVALEWVRKKTPLIEVRCQNDTRFIRYEELIRAIPLDKYRTRLCITDDGYIDMEGSVSSLVKQCSTYGCFIRCKKDLVNIYHIACATDNGFRLSNGDTVRYSPFQKASIIRIMADNMQYLKVH